MKSITDLKCLLLIHMSFLSLGMPNASIPTPEPVKQRKMFGAYGKSVGAHSVAFISEVVF